MSQETTAALIQTSHLSSVNNERPKKMINKTYVKEAKNAKAITRAMAWLKAAEVDVHLSKAEGFDLTVTDSKGEPVEIKVGISTEDARPAAPHLFVLACELTSRHNTTAIKAFHQITEAVGFGTPLPINRGSEPEKKLHFEDNFELVAMRHKEFRKVPNPTAAELSQFQSVITKAVSRFMYINTKICKRHGYEFSDLQTYAQVWTCNYLGLYKVQNPTANDNERKLYAHLVQRFANFVEILLKKERSCIPDQQTTSVALLGRPQEVKVSAGAKLGQRPLDEENPGLDADEGLDTDEDDEPSFEPELDLTAEQEEEAQFVDEAKRRKDAQKALKAEFAKMDHGKLMYLLEEAAANTHLCPDARSEAKKQLHLHRGKCSICILQVFMQQLPEKAICPKCQGEHTRETFGLRVMEKNEAGLPIRVRRQSYCTPCRREHSRKVQKQLAPAEAVG